MRRGRRETHVVEQVDVVVAGAGVVGLAVARALALEGREVLLLDAAEAIGTETSSRNSEVIHAGIYYPAGSLMARLCVQGREMLYAFCRERGVGHSRCGKLIVATSAEEDGRLEGIRTRAAANGVDLHRVGAEEARRLEPELSCVGALLSPETGIVDSHGLMLALQGEAEALGTACVLNSRVVRGRAVGGGVEIEVEGGGEVLRLRCALFVNAAGLHAPALARGIEGMPPDRVPTAYFAKGNYFSLAGRAPFSRLVYPVPVPGGLGVHLTIDLGGQAKFGPDVEWVDEVEYGVDPARAEGFYAAVRRYWPGLRDGTLQPGYAGIRPKIVPPGAPGQDFVVQGPQSHAVPGLINLFGIESPGLTASLALGELVAEVARTG